MNFGSLKEKQIYWLIAALCLIAFFPCLKSDFVYYDDPEYVINNPYIKHLSAENVIDIFKGKATILYVPLTIISYQIEYCFYKLNPHGFHFVNVLFHILNCMLLFKILLKLKINDSRFVGLILIFFALHPLVTESVCWITERKDVLYCFFYLLSANYFLRFYFSKINRYYFISLIFFLLACFSKPMAINLPVLMILFVVYQERKVNLKNLVKYIPFFMISAVFAYVSVQFIKNGATGKVNISGYGPFQKLFLFCSEIGYYFFRAFAPLGNKLFHIFPKKETIYDDITIRTAFFLFLLLLVVIYYFVIRKKNKLILVLFLAWLAVLLPVLQIYPNTHSYVSERYFYLSIIFPVSMMYCFVFSKQKNNVKGDTKYLLVTIAAVFIVTSYIRCLDWKNTETLMTKELSKEPDNAKALNNLGYYYNQKGKFDLAIQKLKLALADDTTNAYYLNNYGWALGGKGKLDSALFYFNKAVLYKRNYFEAINNLAISYSMKDSFKVAEKFYDKALEINPGHPDLLYNLGAFYLKQGKKEQARNYFREAFAKGNKNAQKYLTI